MGGLLAVAYAGDLPAPAQRLAHEHHQCSRGRPVAATAGPDPAVVAVGLRPLRRPAGHASSPAGDGCGPAGPPDAARIGVRFPA